MLIIPVLDLLDGVVVRGIAGKRESYRPVESVIAASASPLDVAFAFRETFGLTTLYVADLDAILRAEPNYEIYRTLATEGFRLLIDSGLRNAEDAEASLSAGATQVIAGLETWPLLSSLEMLIRCVGADRVVFSLDLNAGVPVRTFFDLLSLDPLDIGTAVLEAGVRDMIVLDLASVGVGQGVPTLPLCRELAEFAPRTKLITGGGVRSSADLQAVAAQHLHGVLIASAIHNGAVTPEELANIHRS
ncbi:MAG: HisA/HisF-related TIM barrel protein [Planctomycetaceae bacterium]